MVAHQNGRGVHDAVNHGKDQLVHGVHNAHRGYRRVAQPAIEHAVHGRTHAPEALVEHHGKHGFRKLGQIRPVRQLPVLPAEGGGQLHPIGAAHIDGQGHPRGNHRGNGRPAHAQGRRPQVAINQYPVQERIGQDGADARRHGDHRFPGGLHAGGIDRVHRGNQKARRHNGQVLDGIAKALPLGQENAHHALGEQQPQPPEKHRQHQRATEAQPHGPAHGFHILRPPMLAKKDAATRRQAEQKQLIHEYIAGGLGHRRIRRVPQLADHHPVNNMQRGGHQVLNHNGQAHHQ